MFRPNSLEGSLFKLVPKWCIFDAAMQQIAVTTALVLLCEDWRLSESAGHADGGSSEEEIIG